ncbi:uncharacterized protein EV420DRAFT_1638650 [Desarmillaria tabescens]|uniref:Uncharacterized protein n=1 Tax=Armillaria tabescens TaxID=1929756 RepID=A0AA39NDW8_ARMTA|nr:uncharacterized protein EV420DRAFT_1638650 [Desarmillaria tabescens]KAK0463729.1 hypothetical protein EV420DRAFT_1638650 [Desarmillaria tabescens]
MSNMSVKRKRSSPKSQRSQSRKSPSSKQNPPKVTKKDQAKAKSAQKAQRKQAWDTWLAREENQWSPEQDPNYKQEVGWRVIHYTDAKQYYRFSDKEMEALPYTTF